MKRPLNSLVTAFSITSALMCGVISSASAHYNMRTVPENGLNVNWPVLHDTQYFTVHGLHARNVTLKSIMALDCQHIMDMYDEDPGLLLNEIELLILTQHALRGLNVQAMKPKVREDLALAEIAKRLRQFGRVAEAEAFLSEKRVIPSVGALCHIVEENRQDLLRQLYHVEQKWDIHKVNGDAGEEKEG